ncbi:MAG TPA: hypothetical protein VKC99_05680 [Methyloceanibacter sp.]|nr:hypothetical protein [Methyloceanibacter sp.]
MWQPVSKFEKTRVGSKGAAALLVAAAATFAIASGVPAEESNSEVNVEGGWAYTARSKQGAMEYIAATRAAEDQAWLLLACSADKRLTISMVHAERFPFPLLSSSSLKLRSNNVPIVSIEGKSVQNNQIFVDPRPMRHIMPALLQDDELVVSIPERDGAMHDYTFSMQPNDVALGPIRSRCLDF